MFELELDLRSVTANFNCADGLDRNKKCSTYFSIFCLREGRDTQSTNTGNCPLGRNSERLNAYPENDNEPLPSPQTRRITSPRPWPVREM